MKSESRCIPCFLSQAQEVLELTGANRDTSLWAMSRILEFLKEADYLVSPPELSMSIHQILREETGNPDPYLALKEEGTSTVKGLLPRLTQLMSEAEDPLALAIRIGALGNVIDFGTPARLDIEELVDTVLDRELDVWDFDEFKEQLDKAQTILVLGDNAGEIILDTFLLKELRKLGKTLIYGVRAGPIINDASFPEAEEAGIPELATLISTGSRAPGTLLSQASPELFEALGKVDMLISKGQGNFESLSAEPHLKRHIHPGVPVFFLLTIKCPVVAEFAGVPEKSTVFRVYYP
jgi:damage-control phosphatase, subfamily I